MLTVQRQRIWDIADLVRAHLSLEIPLTLDALKKVIDLLGGECHPVELGECSNDFDASITTDDSNNFVIKYATWKSDSRILFSISHELGHLFLHLLKKGGCLNSSTILHRDSSSSIKELEANEFAAALLMPRDLFISECQKEAEKNPYNEIDINTISSAFNVSTQAATVRGNLLNLW